MADLPLEGRTVVDKKEVPLTVEQRLTNLEKDILELARGVNTQASLLEAVVVSSDRIVQKYLSLMRGPQPVDAKVEEPKGE